MTDSENSIEFINARDALSSYAKHVETQRNLLYSKMETNLNRSIVCVSNANQIFT